jgi:hypothetical protein
MSANIHIDEGTHRSADYPVSDGFHSKKKPAAMMLQWLPLNINDIRTRARRPCVASTRRDFPL